MMKNFNDIEVGDKIYFLLTDSKNETYQEVEVMEIIEVYRPLSHNSFGEAHTSTKYVCKDGVDIEVMNECERRESSDGSINLNEVPPHTPVSFALVKMGNKVTFGLVATQRELIGTCGDIFDRGYELAQRHIKEKYFAFTDAMGMERPYRPPQRLM